jgi:hypothetical protein
MKDKLVIGGLAILVIASLVAFALVASNVLANAVAVQQPSTIIYINSGQTIPFLAKLNTVNGKAYYATISLSAQSGLTASANVTAYPASGTSTTNTTIPIGISVSGNPGIYQLNITVTEYNSSSAPQSVLTTYKYTTYVHIISPQTLQIILVDSTKFVNSTIIGHIKFGNISILNSNIPTSIVSIAKGSNNIQILFNNSFIGMISFQSNVTPSAVYADGQKLTQVFYTVPTNIPLMSWDKIGNTIYVYADPSNITVVYPNSTTNSMTATATGSATVSVGNSPSSTSSTSSNYATQLSSFYEQHKTLILVTIAFIFIVVIVAILLRR